MLSPLVAVILLLHQLCVSHVPLCYRIRSLIITPVRQDKRTRSLLYRPSRRKDLGRSRLQEWYAKTSFGCNIYLTRYNCRRYCRDLVDVVANLQPRGAKQAFEACWYQRRGYLRRESDSALSQVFYNSSKAAVSSMSKALAAEWAPYVFGCFRSRTVSNPAC